MDGKSDKIGTIQRRLAWPLRKDDTQKKKNAVGWQETIASGECYSGQLEQPSDAEELCIAMSGVHRKGISNFPLFNVIVILRCPSKH